MHGGGAGPGLAHLQSLSLRRMHVGAAAAPALAGCASLRHLEVSLLDHTVRDNDFSSLQAACAA
jgi:hypothetical protein